MTEGSYNTTYKSNGYYRGRVTLKKIRSFIVWWDDDDDDDDWRMDSIENEVTIYLQVNIFGLNKMNYSFLWVLVVSQKNLIFNYTNT